MSEMKHIAGIVLGMIFAGICLIIAFSLIVFFIDMSVGSDARASFARFKAGLELTCKCAETRIESADVSFDCVDQITGITFPKEYVIFQMGDVIDNNKYDNQICLVHKEETGLTAFFGLSSIFTSVFEDLFGNLAAKLFRNSKAVVSGINLSDVGPGTYPGIRDILRGAKPEVNNAVFISECNFDPETDIIGLNSLWYLQEDCQGLTDALDAGSKARYNYEVENLEADCFTMEEIGCTYKEYDEQNRIVSEFPRILVDTSSGFFTGDCLDADPILSSLNEMMYTQTDTYADVTNLDSSVFSSLSSSLGDDVLKTATIDNKQWSTIFSGVDCGDYATRMRGLCEIIIEGDISSEMLEPYYSVCTDTFETNCRNLGSREDFEDFFSCQARCDKTEGTKMCTVDREVVSVTGGFSILGEDRSCPEGTTLDEEAISEYYYLCNPENKITCTSDADCGDNARCINFEDATYESCDSMSGACFVLKWYYGDDFLRCVSTACTDSDQCIGGICESGTCTRADALSGCTPAVRGAKSFSCSTTKDDEGDVGVGIYDTALRACENYRINDNTNFFYDDYIIKSFSSIRYKRRDIIWGHVWEDVSEWSSYKIEYDCNKYAANMAVICELTKNNYDFKTGDFLINDKSAFKWLYNWDSNLECYEIIPRAYEVCERANEVIQGSISLGIMGITSPSVLGDLYGLCDRRMVDYSLLGVSEISIGQSRIDYASLRIPPLEEDNLPYIYMDILITEVE